MYTTHSKILAGSEGRTKEDVLYVVQQYTNVMAMQRVRQFRQHLYTAACSTTPVARFQPAKSQSPASSKRARLVCLMGLALSP